jgi:hypothetical protein
VFYRDEFDEEKNLIVKPLPVADIRAVRSGRIRLNAPLVDVRAPI